MVEVYLNNKVQGNPEVADERLVPDEDVVTGVSSRLIELPTEIISLIIDYVYASTESTVSNALYACTLVNRQFYAIANPLLWKAPTLPFVDDSNSSERFFTCITNSHEQHHLPMRIKMGHHVRVLELSHEFWDDIHLAFLIPHVPQLETLGTHYCTSITYSSFRHIPRQCPHLKTVQLHYPTLSQSSFDALGQHCHQLEHLTLDWCTRHINLVVRDTDQYDLLSSDLLEPLALCPLKTLKIYLGEENNAYWDEKTVTALMKFSGLTWLTIYDQSGTLNQLFTYINNTISSTSTAIPWPHLTTLQLQDEEDFINDALLIPFLKCHSYLQYLELGPSSITDASLDTMASALPLLTELYIIQSHSITSVGARRLVHNARRLALFGLYRCYLISLNDFPETYSYDLDGDVHMERKALEKIRENEND